MPRYRTMIGDQPFEFDAANDAAAGRLIDTERNRASSGRTELQGGQPDPVMSKYMAGVFEPRTAGREAGRQTSAAGALGLGTQAGTLRNFNDEIAAAGIASGLPAGTPPILSAPVGAARMLFGDPQATQEYERGLEYLRGAQEGAREAHPVAMIGGEIAGGMAGPLPGASVPALIGRGALEGAVAGFGGGEGGVDRAQGAGIGGAVGAGVAAVLPAVTSAVAPIVRGVRGYLPGAAGNEAADQAVANAMRRDIQNLPQNPGDEARRQFTDEFARRSGQADDQVLADQGGASTQALADWAAQQSPEGRQAIEDVAIPRWQTQNRRAAEFFERQTGNPQTLTIQDQLRAEARRQNAPRYREAYRQGEAGVWSPELQDLTNSDTMQNAIREATRTGRDYAALEGMPAPRNPFVEDQATGRLMLPEGQRPTLQFWDHVQRSLRRQAERAPRGGDEARVTEQLRTALNDRLDVAAPAFGEARRGAAAFFGADDALEAGRNFLKLPARANSAEERRAVGRMNAPERRLFQAGVIENVRDVLRGTPDSADITKIPLLNNPEMRSRLEMALGGQNFGALQHFMTIERGMDRLRGALGNSATARRMIENAAIAGGGGAAAAGYFGENTPSTLGGGLTALSALLSRGNANMNRQAATRIAQLLMSRDPEDTMRVARLMQSNPSVRRAITNGFQGLISTSPAAQAGEAAAGAF